MAICLNFAQSNRCALALHVMYNYEISETLLDDEAQYVRLLASRCLPIGGNGKALVDVLAIVFPNKMAVSKVEEKLLC